MNLLKTIKTKAINKVTPYLNNNQEIILLGDSNTLISYFGLISDKKWASIISKELKMSVGNYGLDGSSTKDFLALNRFKRAIKKNAKYYIICFGLNDEKRRNIEQFEDDTREIIKEIQEKTSGIPILMTNLKVDYTGGHYEYDRNTEKIIPYDNIKRKIASEFGIHLIDVYSRFEKEIEQGNWDHRIRTSQLLDDSQDHLHQEDSNWFSSIHYNAQGNKIVGEEIIKYFKNNILTNTDVS